MKHKINIEALLQIVVLLGCAVFLAYALINDKIKNYVHPRFNVYLWISVAALVIISIFIVPRLFRPKHSVNLAPYIILMIPMLTAFSLPVGSVSNQTISFGNKTSSEISETQKTLPETTTAETSVTEQTAISEPNITEKETESETAPATTSVTDINGNTINAEIINDDGYSDWYMDCYDNPQKYDGKTVQFRAKVFKFDGAAENEFVPARLAMVCCAADTVPWGFLCRSDDISNFSEGDWITVTATIKAEEYNGEIMPILYTISLTSAEPMEDEYIYFY